jgi:hypothetical protein
MPSTPEKFQDIVQMSREVVSYLSQTKGLCIQGKVGNMPARLPRVRIGLRLAHLHKDHCENDYKCTDAEIYVQKAEYEFLLDSHPVDHTVPGPQGVINELRCDNRHANGFPLAVAPSCPL